MYTIIATTKNVEEIKTSSTEKYEILCLNRKRHQASPEISLFLHKTQNVCVCVCVRERKIENEQVNGEGVMERKSSIQTHPLKM